MILGQASGIVSSKNQLAFPKRFRQELSNNLIITKGLEKHLIIVAVKNWEMLLEGTIGKPFIDKETRELQRYLLGNSAEITLDAKGRFVIPEYLRSYAEITNEVIFAGIGKYVELWSKKLWNEYQEYLQVTVVGIAERLSKEKHE